MSQKSTPVLYLIEDSLSMSKAIEEHIKKEFNDAFNFVSFKSISTAFQNDQYSKPDLILLDHILPEAKGVDSISSFTALNPEVKIAIISAQNDLQVFTDAYKKGASEYIRKDALLFHNISHFIKKHLQ